MQVELDEKLTSTIVSYETVQPKSYRQSRNSRNSISPQIRVLKFHSNEEYQLDHVEFITNEDGTISVLIKNIGQLISR